MSLNSGDHRDQNDIPRTADENPVDRSGSDNKAAEENIRGSGTEREDKNESRENEGSEETDPKEPRDLYSPANEDERPPELQQKIVIDSSSRGKICPEEEEEEIAAKGEYSGAEEPAADNTKSGVVDDTNSGINDAAMTDTAQNNADKAADSDTNEDNNTAGAKEDNDDEECDDEDDDEDEEDDDEDEDDDDEDDEDDDDIPRSLLNSLGRNPKSMSLPEGATHIPLPFLMRIRSVETLRLNASLKILPKGLAARCASLRSIVVDDANPNFRSIDGVLYSKDGKTLLLYPPQKGTQRFMVPEPVETIARDAFYRCEQLRSLYFPDTLRTLEECSIVGCPKLYEIYLPRLIDKICHKAFWYLESLERVEVLGTVRLADAPQAAENASSATADSAADLTVADSAAAAQAEPVQERFISVDGVLYSRDLKRLVLYPSGRDDLRFDIPDTVEVIGRGAFLRCANLRTIHLGASVREIELLNEPVENHCMKNCSVFFGCGALSAFDVDPTNSVFRSIDGVLYQNAGRILVYYPPKRKDRVFRIPDSVEVIAPYAFAANKRLERVIFSRSARMIEQGAFLACKNLSSIAFPDSLQSIGDRAFALCESLTEVRLTKSARAIDRSFDGCRRLKRIEVDPENRDFRGDCGVLFSKDLTHLIYCPAAWPSKSAVVPAQVTTIEAGAFEDCSSLTGILVPNTVQIIEDSAFGSYHPFMDVSQTIYAEEGSAVWDYAKRNRVRVAPIEEFPGDDFFG